MSSFFQRDKEIASLKIFVSRLGESAQEIGK